MRKGIKHRLVIDPLRQREPARVFRQRVKFGQGLIDAAMFAAQHVLRLIVVEARENAFDVACQTFRHGNRLLRMAIAVGVEETSEEFVPVVKRRP